MVLPVFSLINFKRGFFGFFIFMYVIQNCFICRPSDFTVSVDAGIEPRTVATLALTARRSSHLAIAKYLLLTIVSGFQSWRGMEKVGDSSKEKGTKNATAMRKGEVQNPCFITGSSYFYLILNFYNFVSLFCDFTRIISYKL